MGVNLRLVLAAIVIVQRQAVAAQPKSKAFGRRGFPANEEVFPKKMPEVIAHDDVRAVVDLEGSDLQVSCCQSSCRNVCKVGLAETSAALPSMVDEMHARLCKVAAHFGKAACNAADRLIMFSTSGSRPSRLFVLLCRASFSPKFQLWCKAEWSPANVADPDARDLPTEFYIDLSMGYSRISPEMAAPAICTSDELALRLAEEGTGWAAFELDHSIVASGSLLRSLVVRRQEVGAIMPVSAGRSARGARNDALADLRELSNPGAVNAWRLPEVGRGVRAASGGKGHRHGRRFGSGPLRGRGAEATASPSPLADDAAVVPIDALGPGDGIASDMDDSDLEALVEVVGADERAAAPGPPRQDLAAEAPAVAASNTGGQSAPQAAPAVEEAVLGPDARGYFREAGTGRLLARRTAEFGTSTVIKCYLHGGKCTLAMATWKVPPADELKEWIASVPVPEPGAAKDRIAELCSEHMRRLRALRDKAVRPRS